jgi:hypothetical protein
MRGRPTKPDEIKPIAPYDSDLANTAMQVIDRIAGEPIPPERLKTYAEALCQYHLSSEDKFTNGQYLDRGRTEWRHAVATGIVLIGKEAIELGTAGRLIR